MKKPGKKITLESVAASIQALAQITAKGFENVATEISTVRGDLAKLHQSQEDIKLRMDNIAYRF